MATIVATIVCTINGSTQTLLSQWEMTINHFMHAEFKQFALHFSFISFFCHFTAIVYFRRIDAMHIIIFHFGNEIVKCDGCWARPPVPARKRRRRKNAKHIFPRFSSLSRTHNALALVIRKNKKTKKICHNRVLLPDVDNLRCTKSTLFRGKVHFTRKEDRNNMKSFCCC